MYALKIALILTFLEMKNACIIFKHIDMHTRDCQNNISYQYERMKRALSKC